jgi:hypothetical protein
MLHRNGSHRKDVRPPWARLRTDAVRAGRRRSAPREYLVALLGGLATVFLACAATTMPSMAQEESQGITGYVACLDEAARRMDDGRSDVAAVAAAVKNVCVARFPEPTRAPGKASEAAQKKYEQRMQARQMELSTMVVQDLRGQP